MMYSRFPHCSVLFFSGVECIEGGDVVTVESVSRRMNSVRDKWGLKGRYNVN